jgi:Cell division cycle-associated protein 8
VSAIELVADGRQLRRSNSVMRKPRQRSAARMSAGYISLSTARWRKACGMTLVRRSFVAERLLEQIGGADGAPVRKRKTQIGDARFEIILQAGQRRRQGAIELHHVVAQQPPSAGEAP